MSDVTSPPLVSAYGLAKAYHRGRTLTVLDGVELAVRAGEFVCVTGQSGSGKSTLLHLLGGLDVADRGEVHWRGERLELGQRRVRDRHRNRSVGFVFQMYHLLPELSALENVMLPAMIRSGWFGFRRADWKAKAADLLAAVGLADRMSHRPKEMSGGEMQRVAIARALIAEPPLLLADEPTGNLDVETGRGIQDLLRSLSGERGLTVVLATHDQSLAARADRTLRLVGGRLVGGSAPATARSAGIGVGAA